MTLYELAKLYLDNGRDIDEHFLTQVKNLDEDNERLFKEVGYLKDQIMKLHKEKRKLEDRIIIKETPNKKVGGIKFKG